MRDIETADEGFGISGTTNVDTGGVVDDSTPVYDSFAEDWINEDDEYWKNYMS